MQYIINTFAVIGFIVTFCAIAGYAGYKIMMYLDERNGK